MLKYVIQKFEYILTIISMVSLLLLNRNFQLLQENSSIIVKMNILLEIDLFIGPIISKCITSNNSECFILNI